MRLYRSPQLCAVVTRLVRVIGLIRDPIEYSIHPITRIHPISRMKVIFVRGGAGGSAHSRVRARRRPWTAAPAVPADASATTGRCLSSSAPAPVAGGPPRLEIRAPVYQAYTWRLCT